MMYSPGQHPGTRYHSQAERDAGKARSKAKSATRREDKRSFEAAIKVCDASTWVRAGGGYWYDGARFASYQEAMDAYDDGDRKVFFNCIRDLADHLRTKE